MNTEQRQYILERDKFLCVLCWAGQFLTVDHIRSRRVVKGVKVDEGWENLWTLCKDCHWAKDNCGWHDQMTHLGEVADGVAMDDPRRRHIIEVLGAMYAEELTLKDIGIQYAAAFLGKEPSQYVVAYENEIEGYKKRKILQARSRASIRKKVKNKMNPPKKGKWDDFPLKPSYKKPSQ